MYIPFPPLLFKLFSSASSHPHSLRKKRLNKTTGNGIFKLRGEKAAISPPEGSDPNWVTIKDEKGPDHCRNSVGPSHACEKEHRGIAFNHHRSLWIGPEEHS